MTGDDSQVFYAQRVDEIIPNIRYCNYNLGDESARKDLVDLKLKSATGSELAESIDTLISQTKENQIMTFSEITWRNKIKIQIKNEKVKLFLLNLHDYEKEIHAASDFDVKIGVYESILKDLVDVVQIVRDELKLDQVKFLYIFKHRWYILRELVGNSCLFAKLHIQKNYFLLIIKLLLWGYFLGLYFLVTYNTSL